MGEEVSTKTVISIQSPTPMWATWVFRITFILTTAATMVIAADPTIPDGVKVRIGAYLKGLDFVIWGISRMLGVQIDQSDFKR